MGYQLNHVCNKPKAFELERTQHDVITWLFHFEESWNTGKPFTQKSFSRNNLWVERKTPSLALGKVTANYIFENEDIDEGGEDDVGDAGDGGNRANIKHGYQKKEKKKEMRCLMRLLSTKNCNSNVC